jgi:hypothetical protein
LPRFWREHPDDFQDAHGRDADDQHLTAVTARRKHDELITPTRRYVGFQGCRHIVGRQFPLADELEGVTRERGDGRLPRRNRPFLPNADEIADNHRHHNRCDEDEPKACLFRHRYHRPLSPLFGSGVLKTPSLVVFSNAWSAIGDFPKPLSGFP